MSVSRVLIVRTGALGDVLHSLAAVAALRCLWPATEIDWVVDPRWAPLLVSPQGSGPVVSGVHLAPTRTWSRQPFSVSTLRSIHGLRHALRGARYDAVVDLQGTLRSAVLGHFAAPGALAGYADPREAAARWLYRRRFARRGRHVVEQGAALLGEALGVFLEPKAAELPRDPDADTWAAHALDGASPRRVAVLAATAGWPAKQWPVEPFAALARSLARRGWRVLVNAPPGGDPTSDAVVQASAGAAEALPCTVAQMVAVVRRAHLVVGGDSGPVHLAAMLGTPVVALYGPTDPARNGPWGPGAHAVLRDRHSATSYKRRAQPDPGLARVRVEQVLAAVDTVC